MSFETVKRNSQALHRRIIVASPEALREIADRLEAAAKSLGEGDSVLCDLTPNITVIYRPEASGTPITPIFEGPEVKKCP